MDRITRKTKTELAGWLFLVFFALSILVLFSSHNLVSTHDPLHHISHAQSVWSGEELNMPVYSNLGEMDMNPWYAFHLYLAPFTSVFDGENYPLLIASVKVAHALLIGVFFSVLFLLFSHLLTRATSLTTYVASKTYGLWLTLLVFAFSPLFVFRIFLLRPHLFSILIIITAVVLLISKRWRELFLIAVVFPLLYSASFLLLIPVGIYTLTKLLYHFSGIPQRHIWTPLLASLCGLGVGIIIHPDTLGYINNAYVVHLTSIAARFFSDIPVGAELYSMSVQLIDWLWIIPTTIVSSVYICLFTLDRTILHRIRFEKVFLFLLTLVSLIILAFVVRMGEYTIPFAILFLGVVYIDDVVPGVKKIFSDPPLLTKQFPGIARTLRELKKQITMRDITLVRTTMISVVGVFICANSIFILGVLANSESFYTFQPTATFISRTAASGEIIFHEQWSDYPRLLFFAPKQRYIMGMDPLFTYRHDTSRYWLWHHLHNPDSQFVCGKRTCTQADHQDIYEVITEEFNARLVVAYNTRTDEGYTLSHFLMQDDRFTQVFSQRAGNQVVATYRAQEEG